jgi:histidine ammonia-lyase
VLIETRADITLDAFRRVAWEGESVEIGPTSLARMDAAHAAFDDYMRARLAEDPQALVYGVTTGPGDAGNRVLAPSSQRPARLWTAASFGEPLPDRVVRGIVLARLANFVDGNATARAAIAESIASMLHRPLPEVPAAGNGGSGEILALGHLFYALEMPPDLTRREQIALINGSPCASALVADVALAAVSRTKLIEQIEALTIEALGAPLAAYSADVEALWDDEHETDALRSLRHLLEGHREERLAYQAPVSFRIIGRVLGQLRRARAEAAEAASIALRSVTDNPVYIPPSPERSLGTIFSTGGYHNSHATAAIDGVATSWADLCQLAERQADAMFQHPSTAPVLSRIEWSLKPLHMVQAGWAEEARALAQPTLLSLGGFGQNDVPAMSFLAWRKATAIGQCLDAALAVLAVLGVHALQGVNQSAPPRLKELTSQVLALVPPVTEIRRLGPDCGALRDAFTKRVYAPADAEPAPSRRS